LAGREDCWNIFEEGVDSAETVGGGEERVAGEVRKEVGVSGRGGR
jgi:hypothetical protein